MCVGAAVNDWTLAALLPFLPTVDAFALLFATTTIGADVGRLVGASVAFRVGADVGAGVGGTVITTRLHSDPSSDGFVTATSITTPGSSVYQVRSRSTCPDAFGNASVALRPATCGGTSTTTSTSTGGTDRFAGRSTRTSPPAVIPATATSSRRAKCPGYGKVSFGVNSAVSLKISAARGGRRAVAVAVAATRTDVDADAADSAAGGRKKASYAVAFSNDQLNRNLQFG